MCSFWHYLQSVFTKCDSTTFTEACGTHKEVVAKLLEDLYLDDVTPGCNSIKEGKKFYKEAKDNVNGGIQRITKMD